MKKIFVLCVSAMFVIINVSAQENQSVTARLKQKYPGVCYLTYDGVGYYEVSTGSFFDGTRDHGTNGACDVRGKLIIPTLYDRVYFRGYYYEVKKDGKVGIRGLNNEELIPCNKYTGVRWYQKENNGYCEVEINGKKGLINKENMEIIPCQYDYVYIHNEDGYIETVKDKKVSIFTMTGNLILATSYEKVYWRQIKKDNYCEVKLNGKTGVIDENGKEIIPCKYDDSYIFQLKEYGYCEVKLNGKRGIVDKNGKELIPCRYDDIYGSELKDKGMCTVMMYGEKSEQGKIDCRLGVVNNKGQEILPAIYTSIGIQKEGYITVGKGGSRYKDEYEAIGAKYAVYDINKKKFITDFKYDIIYLSSEGLFPYNIGAEAFYNGKYLGNNKIDFRGGKWGFIDAEGKEFIPAQYDKVSGFKDGIAQVTKDGVTSLLEHPLKGTNLKFARGSSIAVDVNIPLTNKNNENTFAFIIANENYAHFTGADYSINDGKVFAEYCKKTLGIPEKNVRYYEDATYGNITNAVKKLQDIADVYEGDAKIIFYYSGLGATADKNMEKYLLATDASMSALENTGYSVNTLLKTINNLNVEYSWVVLDAPFSNLDKSGKPLASGRGVAMKSKPVHAEGKTIVTLSSSGEYTAYSSKKYGHSLFTYGLLEKLQQVKGDCSIKELNDYATSWVKKNAMTEFDKMQTPLCNFSDAIAYHFNNIKF